MKNLHKLFCSLLLGFGLMVVAQRSEASVGVRGPKDSFNLSYTTAISSVTPFTVLESTSGVLKPGAVYQVILSTSAVDYCIMFDTNSALGVQSLQPLGTSILSQLGPRLAMTTTNTVITFDPPLLFTNGLFVACSGTNDFATFVYELGRGLMGN